MDKNNSSNNQQYTGKDANDNANQKKNQYVQNERNENPAGKNMSSGNTGLGKGTGLSDEANSTQSEESWQGTSGSMANETQRKNMNQNEGSQDSGNYSSTQNSGMSNNMNGDNKGNYNNDSNNDSRDKQKTGASYSNSESNNKK